jgi:hypothetical protein
MRCSMHVPYYLSLEHKSSIIPEAVLVFVPLVHYVYQHLTTSLTQTVENTTENFIRTWLRILAAS